MGSPARGLGRAVVVAYGEPVTSRAQVLFTGAHALAYRVSHGRVGGRLAGLEQALLTTRGRRSGKDRTVPLAVTRDGRRLLLVASNGGSEHHPAWFLNLRENPDVVVHTRGRRTPMRARVATERERPELWRVVTAANPSYGRLEGRTRRVIPVVVCEPLDPAPAPVTEG